MAKRIETEPSSKEKISEDSSERVREAPRSPEASPSPEQLSEAQREDEQRLAEIKNAIRRQPPSREMKKVLSPDERLAYIEKNLPQHLKGQAEKPTLGARMFGWITRVKDVFKPKKVEGREHIPEKGPYLIVSNHAGGESAVLLGLFKDQPIRITAGYELNWKRSGFRSWLLKKLGFLSINETLSNLSEEEKTSLLGRVRGKAQKKAYAEIVAREKSGRLTPNNDFLRSALASLLQGDAVAVFPEGLFLYDGNRALRKAYGGLEVLAQQYQKMTDKELPILPVGISKKKIGIAEPLKLSEKTGEISDTDWVMSRLAREMPVEERGFYLDKRGEK